MIPNNGERCGISINRNLGNPTLRETSDWPRSRQMACRGSYRDPSNLPLGSIHPAVAYETIRAREDQIKKYPSTPQPLFGMEGAGVGHYFRKSKDPRKFPAQPGERHQKLLLDDGWATANYSGPGTSAIRFRRGVKPLTEVDKIAQAHDGRYMSIDPKDPNASRKVAYADRKMLQKLGEAKAQKTDRLINILPPQAIIKGKTILENVGVLDKRKFISGEALRGMDRPIVERTLRGLEMQVYGSDGREVRGNYFQEQAPTMYGGSSAYAQPGDRPNVVFPASDKRVIPFRGKSFPIPGNRNPMQMPPHHMGQTGGGGDPGRGIAGAPLPPAPFKAQKPGVRFGEEFIQRRHKAPRRTASRRSRRDSKRIFTRKEPETASDLHARKAIEGIETSDGSDDYHLAARAAAQGLMKLMTKKK